LYLTIILLFIIKNFRIKNPSIEPRKLNQLFDIHESNLLRYHGTEIQDVKVVSTYVMPRKAAKWRGLCF